MTDPDYFTLVELRALPDCGTTTFTDAQILAAAAYFVEIVERETNRTFIPRTFTETFSGLGLQTLVLAQTDICSLTTVLVDGVSVTTTAFSTAAGVLRYLDFTPWSSTQPANVVVTYSAGKYALCPADIKNATMWATRDRLLAQSNSAGIDTRTTSMSNELGGTTTYVLPGVNQPTGYPDLDALIASYSRNVPSFGFA